MLMKHAFKNAFSLSIAANITFSWFFLLVLYIKKHNFCCSYLLFMCIDVLILRILQERFCNSSVVEMDFHVLNFMIQTCSVGSSSKLHSSH